MKNGYYSDDGDPIDLDSIQIPALCDNCKKKDLPEEEIPCNLNRYDQQSEIKTGKEFFCGAFEVK
jgi:hypothetical protein